jgi:hypothetical protein
LAGSSEEDETLPAGDHRVMDVREMVDELTTGGWEVTEPVPIPEAKPAIELDELGPADSEIPPRAPEIAVEILSPDDSERALAWKVGAYLAAGTRVVFVVDPPNRTVIAHGAGGELRFGPGETVTHPTMPGFAYAIDAMFEGLYLGKIPKRRQSL